MHARQLTLSLVIVAAVTGVAAQTPVNVVDLIGKTRAEIVGVFPGTESRVAFWRGWHNVVLITSPKGQLLGLVLEPPSPISEQAAEDAVRGLGVTLDRSKYFAGRAEHGYSDMSGVVRTIIYDVQADGRVWAIRIHSALADREP